MYFHKIYRPITAEPFKKNETYMEVSPCDALKPYIRCFWGTEKPYVQKESGEQEKTLVIPDTCMDIIFRVDFTENQVSDGFCGIDSTASMPVNPFQKGRKVSTFAIRFYAWSAVLFSEESMKDTGNRSFDAGYHFAGLKKELGKLLFDVADMKDRIAIAEQYLLKSIHLERNNPVVMEAVEGILKVKGNIRLEQLSKDIHTGSRQLQRLFKENIGISPKQLSSLIRYQYLWNDVLFNKNFNVLDAVYQYGYSDQAHMLHEFKHFSAMTISDARKYALKDVGFLQEKG